MKKGMIFFAALCLVMIVISGCGQADETEPPNCTTVEIKDDGAVVYHLAGEFDREYYSLDELTAMAKEEAARFQTAGNTDDSKSQITVEGKEYRTDEKRLAVITYRFDGLESFAEFTGTFWYRGTLKQAMELGYLSETELCSVKDGKAMSREQLKKAEKLPLLITDIHAALTLPHDVAGVSIGVVPGEKSADTSGVEGKAFILLAK